MKHQQSNRFLHHNYVSVLLNDLFGIQSRSGCACAGPYAQRLLGMTEDIALKIESFLLEDQRLDRHHLRRQREYSDKEILRPGFTRLNLPYFCTDEEIEFILKAVKLVAEKGWLLLPQYLFDPETGEWKHRDHKVFKDRKWLGGIKYNKDGMTYTKTYYKEYTKTKLNLLDEAENIFQNAFKTRYKCGDQTLLFGEDGDRLRWFLLPCEVEEYLKGNNPSSCKNFTPPFHPGTPIQEGGENVFGIEDNVEVNLHHCPCMPYMKEIVQKVPPVSIINRHEKETIEKIEKHQTTSIDNEITTKLVNRKQDVLPESMDKQEEDSMNGKSCTLLCKPVVKRKIGTEYDIQVDQAIKFHNPSKNIFKPAVEGIEEFEMIRNGDRVLVCLSGGKDSLSMLHIIHQYQFYSKRKGIVFELGAMTVDPLSAGYDPSPLIGYCKSLSVEYHYEQQDIIGMATNLPVCESICSFCSRMKRGRIYSCARREKYNVIALGQHLDDIAESFLMSTFHNGYLRSMKANYTVTEGDLRVIRPLIYVREKNLRLFAEKVRLPVIPENCPACFEAPKERYRMKQLLAQQEILFPNLFQSLRAALNPLISKSKTGLEKRSMEVKCEDEM